MKFTSVLKPIREPSSFSHSIFEKGVHLFYINILYFWEGAKSEPRTSWKCIFQRQQEKLHKILIFCVQAEHLEFCFTWAKSYSKPDSCFKIGCILWEFTVTLKRRILERRGKKDVYFDTYADNICSDAWHILQKQCWQIPNEQERGSQELISNLETLWWIIIQRANALGY